MRLLMTFLFLSFGIEAKLVGPYELIKGEEHCPEGEIQFKNTERTENKSQGRLLLFGTSHSWNLTEKESDETVEVVKDGCTYKQLYTKKAESFEIRTTRLKCPEQEQNDIVTEKIVRGKESLSYSYKDKKSQWTCLYKELKKK